jgi:hypothetical protein
VKGDSGSWVLQGGDALGMVIAGSTEASGEHFAYAISMTEVCRSISIGMGGASVHIPTPIENAITAHKVALDGRDTAELAALLIKRMIQDVAREGSDPVDVQIANRVPASCSVIDSLLALARVCPVIRPADYAERAKIEAFCWEDWRERYQRRGRRYIAAYAASVVYGALSDVVRSIMPKPKTWHELNRYQETKNIEGLLYIFLALERLQVGHELSQIARLFQTTMAELGIFPTPSKQQLISVLRNLDRNLQPRRDLYNYILGLKTRGLRSGPKDPFVPSELPKVLAQLFYAASVHRFFVYCGPLTDHLLQLSEMVDLGVILVDTNFDGDELVKRARNKGLTEHPRDLTWGDDLSNEQRRRDSGWVSETRAFVIPASRFRDYYSTIGARFSRYGDVVEHCELQTLLCRLASRIE